MSRAAELASATGRAYPTLTQCYESYGSLEPACEIALQDADVAKSSSREAADQLRKMTSSAVTEGKPLSSSSSPEGNRRKEWQESDSSGETTPLLEVHTSSADIRESETALNTRGYWKSKCFVSIQILNIIGLAIILFGGVVVSVWLYIDRPDNISPCDDSCLLHLITHQDWSADQSVQDMPKRVNPAELMVIAHTATPSCNSTATCKSELRAMQKTSIRQNFTDIKYSFLVGGDGFSYEGRGWNAKGAITASIDSEALVIAFIGNFESITPSKQQLNQARALIKEALYQQKLAQNYKLVAHRQVAHTISPGDKLYDIIRTWDHWTSCVNEFC